MTIGELANLLLKEVKAGNGHLPVYFDTEEFSHNFGAHLVPVEASYPYELWQSVNGDEKDKFLTLGYSEKSVKFYRT